LSNTVETQPSGAAEIAEQVLASEQDDGPPQEVQPPDRPFVVAVGASAGGLEALQRFVGRLRRTGEVSFIVIQHLSPDFKSLMDELLIPHTELKVCRVQDGMHIEPDTIHLMPPKHEMRISGGRLFLTERDPGKGLFLPIDAFFKSLAEDLGPRAVAVVLSGTGSDGSRGLRAVHEAGGLVIAQSEDSAKFDGMPRSAVDTGVVDLVLAPEEIADALHRYAEQDGRLTREGADGDAGKDVMERIFSLLQRESGIDFGDYKSGTVGRRIERRLLMTESLDLERYVDRVEQDPNELRSLYKDLLIGVTRFFRDPEAFQKLRTEVIPPLIDRLLPGEEMRIWVPGCATGEEPYGLAIVISEAFRERQRTPLFRIFATDVHRASLEVAGAGRFTPEGVAGVPPGLRDLYFEVRNEGYQVRTELRERVVFAHHNILRDAPFTRLDLLSCRNLLIYFKPQAQRRLLALFHFALKTGGAMLLGPSESPGPLSDEFEVLDARWKMYRKLRDVRLTTEVSLGGAGAHASSRGRRNGQPLLEDLRVARGRESLLKRFLPPSVVVDDSFRILQTYNGAGEFLVPRDGEPSLNLLDLLQGDVRVAVAAALRRAQKEGGFVTLGAVDAITHRGPRRVRVVVGAAEATSRPNESWVVAFQPDEVELPNLQAALAGAEDTDRSGLVEMLKERVSMLENELRATRESLQTSVEEMETSNEELQATNEELVASNEELQSTNEELNSVNEELHTVNGEYQLKITELTELTADMNNLLEATEVDTIFLDRELRVRKFTPNVGETFNLMPQDVGRRLDAFSHSLKDDRLLEEVRQVLVTGTAAEREVVDRNGRMFFLRILPYRVAQSVEGVVLTLIDISALRRAQDNLAASEERYRTLVRSITAILWTADRQGNFSTPQPEWEAYTGHSFEVHRGQGWLEAIHVQDRERVREAWRAAVASRQPFVAEGRLWNQAQGTYRYFVARAAPVATASGDVREWIGHVVDMHDSKGAELELRKKEEQIHAILERSPVFIYLKDLEGKYVLAGSQCQAVLGRSCDEVIGRTDYNVFPLVVADQLRAAERQVIETGETCEDEVELDVEGESRTFLVTRFPLRDESGIYAVAGIFTDITERKRTAEEAQQAVDRRDRFLAMLSHELRTPLGAILNASHLLGKLGDGIAVRERQIIIRQARHMAKLIEDLLDVGRITREQVVLDPRPTDLRALLVEVAETESLDAEKLGLKLESNVPTDPVIVQGDGVRLRQIFVNLISNCLTYTPAGEISVSLRTEDGSAVVEVKDTGVGMTGDELGHVFEIFYQAPQSIDRPRGGLGVGLTLARQLARLHGGDVAAQSDGKGKGSTFSVKLPLVVPDEEQAAESQACEQPLGRMRIAIVEDNADIRDTLGELLALEGHEVFLAGDGPSGLRVILENKPDVALLDLGLPRMDGYELARTVRSSCGSEVKLVALTGYGRDEDRAKSRQAGFNHHLVKPVEETVLARLLAEIEAAKGGPAGPQPSVIEVRSENEVRLRTPIGSGNNDN
jgi:two-component system, chemotaxis family, CheB/CheR fusion protein